MMHSERCPVCNGNGLVPNGFYRQTTGDWTSSSATPEKCRTCDGKGYITVGDPVDVRPIYWPVYPYYPRRYWEQDSWWDLTDPQTTTEWFVAGIDTVSHGDCTIATIGTKATASNGQKIAINWSP